MFRKMRRTDRETSIERAIEILKEATYGVFTVFGDDGYPYGVPVNHIYLNDSIYFHAAKVGKKADSFMLNNKCGYTAVAYHDIVPEKTTTSYASCICMGTASFVEGDEKLAALNEIMRVFAPEQMGDGMKQSDEGFKRTAIVKIEIEHITGKENDLRK